MSSVYRCIGTSNAYIYLVDENKYLARHDGVSEHGALLHFNLPYILF